MIDLFQDNIKEAWERSDKKDLCVSEIKSTAWWLVPISGKINMEDKDIESISEYDYKRLIKGQVRKAAFAELEEIRSGHSKVSQNNYSGIDRPQPYIINTSISSR